MASFHNITNEKSSVFEDADYDPDLEARLYAEIYYSNDNYQQDYVTTDNDSQNIATSLTSSNSIAPAIGKDNFVVDTDACASHAFEKSLDQRTVYPSKSWVFGDKNRDARRGVTQQFVGTTRAKPQRLLAHKDLWLPKAQPEAQRRSCGTTLQNLEDLSLDRRLSEAETFATAVRRSKETRTFSTPFANRSVDDSNISAVVNRSNEAQNFSTQFGGGPIGRENISIGSNSFNVADDFSIQLQSGATVNRCNETENTNRQFESGAINSNNFRSYFNRNETRNDCSPLVSGSIEVENIRLAGNRFNTARNFSTPFRSGTIDDCDIPLLLNNSEISTPQFGRKNTGRNSRTILTRSKTARRRTRNADTAENFVAESLETDFNGEGLFNSYLANQVENFGCISGNESDTSLVENRRSLLEYIKEAGKLARINRKKKATRRRAERKRKQRELRMRSKCSKNADVTTDDKYKVVSKKSKLSMKEMEPEPVDISSDSDDSILEVPVPPKAPPPVIQLQDSDDDLDTDTDKSRNSPSKKDGKTNSDESSSYSDENDSSKDEESSAVSTCESGPGVSGENAKKSKTAENLAPSNNQQQCEDDSGKSSKSRSKKGKKSAESNREESVASLILETDSSAESPAEPIVETSAAISRDTPKKTKTAENSGAISNVQECEEDSGKSNKNRQKKGKKSVEDNQEESPISRIPDTDSPAETSSEPIADSRPTISRETPKKTKNVETSVATPNIQESEGDSGKSSKNRSKKGKKSAEEPREDSTACRISETDFSTAAESAVEPIAKSSLTISQKISRETPKKAKNSEHSVAISSIQECEDDSAKSTKNRPKKSKKSAEEIREESAPSRISETDCSAESLAEPIAESSLTISQKTSRETPKKPKNAEQFVATPNSHECNDDTGKSVKNRPKKGRKLAEEPREESAASLVSEADFSAESSVEPIADSSATVTQKISRDTPKKTKNPENSVAPSNEQEIEDDSGKSSKSKTKKGKKSAEDSREEIPASQILESSSKDDESSAATIREAKLQKILKDAVKKSRDTEISATISNPDDGNLILNCTEIQKGASSLEEIRKMREAANSMNAHSEDSMTENEASNWVNIAASQANSSRKDDEICSISSSIDGSINPALWDQLAQENRAAAADSSIETETRAAEDFLPIETTTKSPEEDFHAPVTNSEATSSRKRQKASSPFNDFDVPAVPEKRAKSKQKTSREQTMTEYFFKPMSKELQAFYNNPWGGENLDVYDMQSRMPRNPNCWAILDADLRGPISKRGRMCPRCKTDTHYGRRCPEKAKPPCCYMCGVKGHTESRCPHTMCLTCGRKYSTYRPTCGHCSQLQCTICKGLGHSCENCPDLWRRYHNTTTPTAPMVPKYASTIMKPSQNLSCCNCAKRGHDVTMCKQLRWSQHFPTPMYITSYTAGPMYEPSNIFPVNQPLINDSPHEFPNQDQYFDAVQSNQSNPDFSQNEFFQESIADTSIESIEIPNDSSFVEPEISLSQGQIIFRAGELDPRLTLGWHRCQKRLDTEKSIELTGILSGTVKPAFLLNWQQHLQFGVEIIHDNVAGTYITIACTTTRIFREFEKVVWQWLLRTDAEKTYLIYETNPFEISSELVSSMKLKLVLPRNVMPVVALLKKIASSDATVISTAANVKSRGSKKDRRRLSAIWAHHGVSSIRRCQLITSLYSGNFVEKGDILLQRFKCLARERLRRLKSSAYLGIREYYQLVYAYNEIFAFHQTETLTKALEKAIASYREQNSVEAQTLDWNTLSKFPKAEIVESADQSNFLAATIAEIPTSSAVDSLAESLPFVVNSAANCVANIDLQSAGEPHKVNASFSNVFQQVPAANSEIPTNAGTQNPGGSSAGVLMFSLGKKARKNYRKLAKTAIKAANKSNVPRLQKIAKTLGSKMANCTILTDEIDSLQREISNDLRRRRGTDGKNLNLKNPKTTRKLRRTLRQQEQNRRQSNQQSQQNSPCNNNPACVKFLRKL